MFGIGIPYIINIIIKLALPKIIERAKVTVRMKGLEPIRRKTLDPKSSAATNYATCADL